MEKIIPIEEQRFVCIIIIWHHVYLPGAFCIYGIEAPNIHGMGERPAHSRFQRVQGELTAIFSFNKVSALWLFQLPKLLNTEQFNKLSDL